MTNTLNNILSKDIANSYAPMGRAEEVECIIKAKAGNHVAQNKLVNSQLKRIVAIARAYSNHINSVQDLISEGTIGLIHAITLYDIEKANDIRFHSYAQWWIREHIGNYVCDNQLILLPRNQSKSKKEVRDDNGKVVVPRKEGTRVNSLSLNAPVSEDSNAGTFESTFVDDKCLGADTLAEYTKAMGKLNEALTEHEMDMFEARVFDEMTYEDMAKVFNFNSREVVRQHLNKIFDKAQRICKK
jgi:RNA polymerase sigma factor (sigma-70 family)